MAPASGRNDTPVSERLYAEGHRFDFFQAVRVLNRIALAASDGEGGRSRQPVGGDAAPRQESARFRALASHSFPPGAISEVRLPARPRPAVAPLAPEQDALGSEARLPVSALSAPPEVVTAFFGLTGPSGVLPPHYTTLLIERVRAKDYALRDFLDLFNHRLTSLFCRAWQKYRFPFAYEQSCWVSKDVPEDLVTQCLYCLLGLGTDGLRGRLAFDDEALLFYAGHFAHYPRSALSLERLLADYFELPVAIRQFHGQWLYLSEDSQSSLPCSRWPEGLNTQMGSSLLIGERVWDVEGKFRLRVGPLDYAGFRRLMPSGDVLQPLAQMVRTYAGPQFAFDVQVVLKAAEVPCCRLGGEGTDPSRLGWNTWALSAEVDHDVSDAVFSWEG
jgi:type VI secretion system protein ImpH